MNEIRPPWDAATVEALNAFQAAGRMHPFTCGNSSRHRTLVATENGWQCLDCEYTQNWAHEFMTDPTLGTPIVWEL
jgi:hypothetical protein